MKTVIVDEFSDNDPIANAWIKFTDEEAIDRFLDNSKKRFIGNDADALKRAITINRLQRIAFSKFNATYEYIRGSNKVKLIFDREEDFVLFLLRYSP